MIVVGDEGASRLDRVLAVRSPDLSRSRLKALILAGQVSIDGQAVRDPSHQVAAGTAHRRGRPARDCAGAGQGEHSARYRFRGRRHHRPQQAEGLVVHPPPAMATGTLVDAADRPLRRQFSGIGEVRRPGIVHRLDKETTGLMVAAKNDRAHASLSAQFADHGRTAALRRGYMAIRLGRPGASPAWVLSMRRSTHHPYAREKTAAREGGGDAITHSRTVESYPGRDGKTVASLLAASSRTAAASESGSPRLPVGHPLLGTMSTWLRFPRPKARQLGAGA